MLRVFYTVIGFSFLLLVIGCEPTHQMPTPEAKQPTRLEKPVNPLMKKIGLTGSVLVYFDKKGCPACAQMAPNIDQAVKTTGIRLIKTIPDRQTRIDFGLGHFPTYCIYINGREYRRWIGVIPTQELIDEIKRGHSTH